MRIAIVANTGDPCGDHVEARARHRGIDVLRHSLRALITGEPFSWPLEAGRDAPRFDVDAVFVRQFPSQTALLGPPEALLSHEAHYALQRLQRDRHAVALSLLAAWQARGARVVNPTESRPYDDKPFQLDALARAGVPIPRTLLSNDAAALDAFAEEMGGARGVVVKPVDGGAFAQLWSEIDAAWREKVRRAPVIAQERVPGVDVRVTVVNGRVISAVAMESTAIDYRADRRFAGGEDVLSEATLDDRAQAVCVLAARTCHQVLSGIDARLQPDGSLTVLECNSAPVFLEAEQRFGHPITDALLDGLTSG